MSLPRSGFKYFYLFFFKFFFARFQGFLTLSLYTTPGPVSLSFSIWFFFFLALYCLSISSFILIYFFYFPKAVVAIAGMRIKSRRNSNFEKFYK